MIRTAIVISGLAYARFTNPHFPRILLSQVNRIFPIAITSYLTSATCFSSTPIRRPRRSNFPEFLSTHIPDVAAALAGLSRANTISTLRYFRPTPVITQNAGYQVCVSACRRRRSQKVLTTALQVLLLAMVPSGRYAHRAARDSATSSPATADVSLDFIYHKRVPGTSHPH